MGEGYPTGYAIAGGGGGAPVNAEYLVGAANVTLTAARVVTNTATETWDLSTPGQAKANASAAPAPDQVARVLALLMGS